MRRSGRFILSLLWAVMLLTGCGAQKEQDETDRRRMEYGRSVLASALRESGMAPLADDTRLVLAVDPGRLPREMQRTESYQLRVDRGVSIMGYDAAGVLYGCLDLAERIRRDRTLPRGLNLAETPVLKWRGAGILLMKLGSYNYPITPQEYPFFYDRQGWLEYLDFLAASHFNYVALWNGHPFDYFVELLKYPEAQAGLDPAVLQRNREMMHWLIAEGRRRNITFFWEFYNIHTSVYYQQAHHLPDEIDTPTPELAEYTGYVIERFVREFPQVGLYITAGEALDKQHAVSWVTDVILAAVRRSGKNPPVFLRSWFLNLEDAKKISAAWPGLCIESKYNVEMIADTLIDPMNRDWAGVTGEFIVNIHMAGNLEPFRWNPPRYIRKCLQSATAAGATGLHLYPRKSWRWPDISEPGVAQKQIERDELWFRMWGRCAWNMDRDQADEAAYWQGALAEQYGAEAAAHLLQGFESIADALPAVQRLFWAGFDNHTVVTAGLTLKQIERAPGIPFLSLDPVMRIPEFLAAVKRGEVKDDCSPLTLLDQKANEVELAIGEFESARRTAEDRGDEIDRYLLDARATALTLQFYRIKLQAAIHRARTESKTASRSSSLDFLRALEQSVQIYRQLTDLTDKVYDSISDVPAYHPVELKKTPYHWRDLLPLYEKEYALYHEAAELQQKPASREPERPGLVGLLFGDPNLNKPKRVFIAQGVEFDWNVAPPDNGRNWSVLLSGAIESPVTGDVTLVLSSEQQVIISFDGEKVMTKNAEETEARIVKKMAQGRSYALAVDFENVDYKGANLSIRWILPSAAAATTIDPALLRHSEFDINGAERTVMLGF